MKILRKIHLELNEKKLYNTLLVETDWCEFEEIQLSEEENITLIFGEFICTRCRSYATLRHGYCDYCIHEEMEFVTRINCLFNNNEEVDTCKKPKPLCCSSENAKFCFQKYILYLGRIGESIKVGISREKRQGGYLLRLLEQGLEEAIVIKSFKNLPEVLIAEKWFENIGFASRITDVEKCEQIQTSLDLKETGTPYVSILGQPNIAVNAMFSFWPKSMILEKFGNMQIEYLNLYDHKKYAKTIIPNQSPQLKGKILRIIGQYMVIDTGKISVFVNLSKFLHREVLEGTIW
ncbi:MAG: DUF2797 domain-containing protein [Candidatus Heimdallarchaeota archaeon]|nr:DUF2797 domain-containing protein [Candidatus Heimdallarchaeota archaeon]